MNTCQACGDLAAQVVKLESELFTVRSQYQVHEGYFVTQREGKLREELQRFQRLFLAAHAIGSWISAALDDPWSCREFKTACRALLVSIEELRAGEVTDCSNSELYPCHVCKNCQTEIRTQADELRRLRAAAQAYRDEVVCDDDLTPELLAAARGLDAELRGPEVDSEPSLTT